MNEKDKHALEIGRVIILATHSLLDDRKVLLGQIKKLKKALRQARRYYRENKPKEMLSTIKQALK